MTLRTRFVISSITLVFACAMLAAAFADQNEFRAGPATDYAHQQSENVTVGAKPYDSEELTASAFGKKTDFLKYGVLPIFVVVENKREKALDLRSLEVNLVAADGRHATSVSPEDLPGLANAGKHTSQTGVKARIPLPKRKNPLNAPEIVTRAFSAKMLAPGDSASGFFYFEAKPESGDKLYLNGLRDARSRRDLLYFEFSLRN